MAESVALVLIEQNLALRQMIEWLLATFHHREVRIIGIASNLNEARRLALDEMPTLVLVGVGLTMHSELAELGTARIQFGAATVIVLGPWEHAIYRDAALAHGADGYIAKTELNTALPLLIRLNLDAEHEQG